MRDQTTSEIRADVEAAIQKRDRNGLRLAIHALLETQRGSPAIALEASEYLRRFGLPSEALRILNTASPVPQVRVQIARILNLLGASSYALRIVDSIDPHQREQSRWQIAGIHLSNYQYARALSFYREIETFTSFSRLDYSHCLSLIGLADCYAGLGESERAESIFRKLSQERSEPLIRGIALQALGTQALLSARHAKARALLEQASLFFPTHDRTPDRAFLDKWRGALAVHTGEARRGLAYLKRAWKVLYRPGTKPEAWLEVLYWMRLARWRQTHELPNEWRQILTYPTPGHRMTAWIHAHWRAPLIPQPHRALHMDLNRDEIRQNGILHLGLNLGHRLLAHLAMVGSAGVPQYRCYDLLWPNEPLAFAQHQKRLEQVVLQARALLTRNTLEWKDNHLRLLSSRGKSEVSAHFDPQLETTRGGSFLQRQGHDRIFIRADVQRYFSIPSRTASALCQLWITTGKCVQVRALGSKAAYQSSTLR